MKCSGCNAELEYIKMRCNTVDFQNFTEIEYVYKCPRCRKTVIIKKGG